MTSENQDFVVKTAIVNINRTESFFKAGSHGNIVAVKNSLFLFRFTNIRLFEPHLYNHFMTKVNYLYRFLTLFLLGGGSI